MEKYRLLGSLELVCEVLARDNGTLIDECTAIGVIGIPLEDPVPMLYKVIIKTSVRG